ncbi:MAG TPA: DUF4139 domain-containing protein, partial [Sandaracinaceae bacterium LLY-WYZ-13_1]|nr:DUF4139 domain-containing protein [Sandaracinaceae bacterium LLY-WYZ-13_1]
PAFERRARSGPVRAAEDALVGSTTTLDASAAEPPDEAGEAGEPAEPELTAAREMLDYGRLRLAAPHAPGRGKLVLESRRARYLALVEETRVEVALDDALTESARRARDLARAALPSGCVAPAPSGFDYVYRTDGRLDAPSDGAFHALSLSTHEAEARPRFVVVPRESRDAFRYVEIDNPLDAPLLDGPVDVYVGADFLTTSRVREVPPGGVLRLGLGVEERLGVARNTRYAEKSSGLIGGRLDLEHTIEVSLSNQLPTDADVEVRERLPTAREEDDDVAVREDEVEPPWEAWEPDDGAALEGGRRWRLVVPAGAERALTARYTIRIASKHELVGGNRRES